MFVAIRTERNRAPEELNKLRSSGARLHSRPVATNMRLLAEPILKIFVARVGSGLPTSAKPQRSLRDKYGSVDDVDPHYEKRRFVWIGYDRLYRPGDLRRFAVVFRNIEALV